MRSAVCRLFMASLWNVDWHFGHMTLYFLLEGWCITLLLLSPSIFSVPRDSEKMFHWEVIDASWAEISRTSACFHLCYCEPYVPRCTWSVKGFGSRKVLQCLYVQSGMLPIITVVGVWDHSSCESCHENICILEWLSDSAQAPCLVEIAALLLCY